MKTILLILLSTFLLSGCDSKISRNLPADSEKIEESVNRPEITFHQTHEPKKADAPFSDVVQVGNMYFLSGQIGMNHSVRKLVDGGIEAETTQVIDNIEAVLKQHNLTLKDVVKATVILKDINDFSVFNEIYKTRFPQKPARMTFAASGLAAGASIEIEVVAAK